MELTYGAHPHANGTTFRVWAPNARQLAIRVRTGNATGEYQLARDAHGVFAITIAGVRAGDDYVYCIDGGAERPDPSSR